MDIIIQVGVNTVIYLINTLCFNKHKVQYLLADFVPFYKFMRSSFVKFTFFFASNTFFLKNLNNQNSPTK